MVGVLKAGKRPPWVGLGAAVWVQIASGNAYNFPLYSHTLKSVLGFNQRQLTMLGVANDIGENVGLLPGIVCNYFPPWVVLSIGSLCCFFGYGVLWLSLSRTVLSLPYWLLWLALCVATNSSAWLSTSVLVTNMRNFPVSRGTVAGILKGYGGLSAAVYTEIFSVILHSSSPNLLLVLALGVPILCFLVMYFVRPCTPSSRESSAETTHFVFIQAASVVLGIYLLTTTVLGDAYSLSQLTSYIILSIMILLLMAPLAIPLKMTLYPIFPRKTEVIGQEIVSSNALIEEEGNLDKTEPLLMPSSSRGTLGSSHESEYASDIDILLAEGEGAVKKKRRPKRGDDFTFREALIKADFWLLFLVYFVGVGSGVTVLNNLAQIGIALGDRDATILLSIFSFFNFVGRLGGGSLSEYFVRTRTLPRTVWLTCTQVIMIIVYLLFATGIDGTLYAATAMLGLCYGTQFSIMIPTVSELFGLKHFGLFYNFISIDDYRRRVFFNYEKRLRLRSPPEKVFEYFASVKSESGEVLMTPADLVRAVIPLFPPSESNYMRGGNLMGEESPGELQCPSSRFFMLFDTNSDGLISFSEYIFFVTLLSIPESSFTVAFKMFDIDHNGEIDKEEFQKVMGLMRNYSRQGSRHCDGRRFGFKPNVSLDEDGGMIEHFFGKDGKQSLPHDKFVQFLRELHEEILRLEFAHYDHKLRGSISAKDFALSMVASADVSHMNKLLDKVEDLNENKTRITYEEFRWFSELRKNISLLSMAMFSQGEANGLLTRDDFQRAASYVCGISLSNNVVDIIFHVFDSDGDGNLSSDEFLRVLQKREAHHSQPKETGVKGLMCSWLGCNSNC